MVRRTKQEALATRDLILDTAEVVFQAHGVSGTSLNEIAQAAGLTRGAIYWHFKDKADLFNAMMQRVTLPLEDTAKRSDDPLLEDPIAYMRSGFLHALRLTVDDPQMRRVFEIATHKVEYVGELTAVRDRHLAIRDECLLHGQRGIALAVRRGQLPKGTPARAVALGLHALIDGLLQNWMLDPDAFDLVKVGTQVFDTYLAGLTVPRPHARAPARSPRSAKPAARKTTAPPKQ